MKFEEFKDLLGKNITETNRLIDKGFEIDPENNNLYFIGRNSLLLYNRPAYNISTNKKDDIIDAITFYFKEIINDSFYNAFINDFGIPDSIQVVENIKIISEGENEEAGFNQYLRKSFIETREGGFEEKPFYMIWNKENYQIKILLNHKLNITTITFRNPSDRF